MKPTDFTGSQRLADIVRHVKTGASISTAILRADLDQMFRQGKVKQR